MTHAKKNPDVIRIANCSGFLGDRQSAAREMVMDGPIDVLTGDYLAEVTMSVFQQIRDVDPNGGYAFTFLAQAREILAECLDRNIKIVVNAGAVNPKGLADELENLAQELHLEAKIAYIDGDDLMPRLDTLQDSGEPFTNLDTGVELAKCRQPVKTANAYLGAWGIKEALDWGADIVIAPRVTDASLIMGPAAWKFGWKRDDFDALAGALVAGHIIECGTQATGGNYSFFKEVPTFTKIGFPIAEIEADGSCTITKHPGTGGLVSTGTVISQLLYEIDAPAYRNPDVIAHFDTIDIRDLGDDRVRVSGVRGSSPPQTHKVCMTVFGGYKSTLDVMLAGLDIEEKAAVFSDALFELLGGRDSFDEVTEQLIRRDHADPATQEVAFASLLITLKSRDENKVRQMAEKEFELSLSNIPGFFVSYITCLGPVRTAPFMFHWPAQVDSRHIVEQVHMGERTAKIIPTSQLDFQVRQYEVTPIEVPAAPSGKTRRIPFGRIYGTRSGDKGAHTNLGVWARSDGAYRFLYHYLTVDKLKELLPDNARFEMVRYDMPNIRGMNFLIKGSLGDGGVTATTRLDGMNKSLGEYLRAKMIEAPEEILDYPKA